MGRRSRTTGVGRGNGLGSAPTQFKEGMPSANPNGRPRKEKLPPPQSLHEALAQALHQPVKMREGGREKTVPQFQAMVDVLFNDFQRATPAMKMRMLQFAIQFAYEGQAMHPPELPHENLKNLVDWLVSRPSEV